MKKKAFCAGDFVIIFIGILGFVYECVGQLAKQLNEANILKKGLDLIADADTIEEKAEAEQTMRAELRGVAVAAAASLGHTAGHGMKGAIPPRVLIREIRGRAATTIQRHWRAHSSRRLLCVGVVPGQVPAPAPSAPSAAAAAAAAAQP